MPALIEPRRELLRPWKLFTLDIGLGLLLVGAFWHGAPDWDVGISLLMAIVAYATAPIAIRILRDRQWRRLPLAAFLIWFGVDGSYAAYWFLVDPWALAQMRSGQWSTSLCLYLLCGLIWMHQGDLKSLLIRKPRAAPPA